MKQNDLEVKIEMLEAQIRHQKLMLDNSPNLLFLTDENNEILQVHGDLSDLYISPEDIIHKRIDELLPNEVFEKIKKSNENAKKSGFSQTEYTLKTKNYNIKTKYNDGFFSHSISNITQKKQIEIQKNEKANLLENVINNLFDMISFTDLEGNFTFVGGSHKFLGYDSDSMIGTNVMDYVHPDDKKRVMEEFVEFMTNLEPKRVEYRYETVNKEYVWLETQGSVILDKNKRPERFVFSSRDVTKRKELEEKLMLKNLMLDQIDEYVTITNLEGNIIYVNESEKKLFNKEQVEMLGKSIQSYGENPKKGATQKQILEETLKNGKWRGEVVNYDFKGEEILLDCRTQIIYDKENNPVAISGISTDITKRKEIENDLVESVEEKELLMKEIHHRVKNNMQLIRSIIYLQKEDMNLDESSNFILDKIDSRILAMSKAYQCIYEQKSNLTQISSKNYIENSLTELFSVYNIENKIKLNLDIDDFNIDIDTAMSVGIVINEIVSNSLKYAHPDGSKGEINVVLKSSNNDSIDSLVIEDDGCGFEKEKSGFGTYVCELLSKQVGLELNLVSKKNIGTKYILKNKVIEEKVNYTNGKILLVEDDVLIGMARKSELKKLGYLVEESILNSGEKLLNYLSTTQNKPDLVLMDVGLAGNLDGVETALKLRESYDFPIIFVSGYAGTEEFKNKIKNISNSDGVEKTISKYLLKEKIDSYLK